MEGVQNPNKKMKVEIDKHQRDSEYDRRVRTFQNSWKKGRSCLIFNKPQKVTTCSFFTGLAAARNENNSSAFVAGCDNFRITPPPIVTLNSLKCSHINLFPEQNCL